MDALKVVKLLNNLFHPNCLCVQWVHEQATSVCVNCENWIRSLSQTSKAPFKHLKHSKRLKAHLRRLEMFSAFKTFKAFKALKVL